MSYGTAVTVPAPYEQTVARVREALQGEGFGVLTEIDVTSTMRDKLGAEMEPYVILGACNPPLAHAALEADRSIGLLLPCNVVVRGVDGGSRVEALDPLLMVDLTGKPELKAVADDAAARLARVLEQVSS